jgi:hypothetical protein
VVDNDERPEGGPAWLLAQPGFMDDHWDGQPRTLPAGRRVPRGTERLTPCPTWAAVTGDAGWAGVVAESWLSNRTTYLIFEVGTNTLQLIREAIALLPPRERWEATFASYFTGVPSAVACSCRCVLNGSPEALRAQRLPNVLTIDLSRALPRASGGTLVGAARTGKLPSAAIVEGNSLPIGAVESVPYALPDPESPSPPEAVGPTTRPRHEATAASAYPLRRQRSEPPPTPTRQVAPPPKRGAWIWWVSAGVPAAVLLLASGLFLLTRARPEAEIIASKEAAAGKAPEVAPKKDDVKVAPAGQEIGGRQPLFATRPQGEKEKQGPAHHSDGPQKGETVAKADSFDPNPGSAKASGHDKDQTAKPKPAIPNVAKSPSSPPVLKLPELGPGQSYFCEPTLGLEKNEDYSLSLLLPAEFKIKEFEVAQPQQNRVQFADVAGLEQLLGIDVDMASTKLRVELPKKGREKSEPTPEQFRDLLQFSRVLIRPSHHRECPITRQFFDPSSQSVAPVALLPPTEQKGKTGRRPKGERHRPEGESTPFFQVPLAQWHIRLPLGISAAGPKLYVEDMTLKSGDHVYHFEPAKGAAILRFSGGKLLLRCKPLSEDLVRLALGAGSLRRTQFEPHLAEHDAIVSIQLKEEPKATKAFSLDVALEAKQVQQLGIILTGEHYQRLVGLLERVFDPQWMSSAVDDLHKPPLERIAWAKREVRTFQSKDHSKRSDEVVNGLDELDSQMKELQNYLIPLTKAKLVTCRIYFKVQDRAHPNEKAVEMDLLRIDDSSSVAQSSK